MEKRYYSNRVGRMSALLFLAMATMLSAVMYAAPQQYNKHHEEHVEFSKRSPLREK